MKKLLKVLALVAVVACCAVAVAFAGCGESAKTYDGEYKYENAWSAGKYYGVKVHVTVKGDKITEVTYDADKEDGSYVNVSPTWTEGQHEGDLGAAKTKAAVDKYLADTFVGKTVAEVKALSVAKADNGEPKAVADGQTLASGYILSGATQTSGRFVLAIQDALKNA